jgi:aspartyl-tRNA(Asn)/glutamyl-tRNA(Gln) amidotransferase subunit A
MTDDIARQTAIELLGHYRRKSLSPVDAAKAVIDRIRTKDGVLNAFCLLDEEAALAAARQSEARWAEGKPRGRLDGVPVSIKDIILTKGWPTRRGSKTVDPEQPWDTDAPSVARLREQGAVLIGKTTTPEFGWKGVTDSPLTGVSRNPWDSALTPGGSSGGSAAAVIAGMAPLSIGTDGGGSIRIPAAFCGAVGMKASFGRVPAYPPSPFGTLAHVGPIARTVSDVALMLSVIAGPDARDWYALPSEGRDYGDGLDDGVKGLRVAFSKDLGYARVEGEVARVVSRAAHAFEGLGAIVEEVHPGFENPHDSFLVSWFVGAARVIGALTPAQRELVDPGLLEIAEKGAGYNLDDYLDAGQYRAALGTKMRLFHKRYDLLLTPAMPLVAFAAGQNFPTIGENQRWLDWSPFTYPFNFTGQPAISVPCGFTNSGLPVGLQIIATNYADALVLRAAQAYQGAHPETVRQPAI